MIRGPLGADAPPLRERVARHWRLARALGWVNGAAYLLDRALALASGERLRFNKCYVMAQPVATARQLPARRGAQVAIRRLAASDPLLEDLPRPRWLYPFRFGQRTVCFAALLDGRCVGCLWLALGPYREDDVRCLCIPGPAGRAAWDFDVYVAPEHRNGIVFLRLWDEANAYLGALGYEWSMSRVSAFNTGSLHSHARMGARTVASIAFFVLGSCQLLVATVPPYAHLSLSPRSYATLRLSPTVKNRKPESVIVAARRDRGSEV